MVYREQVGGQQFLGSDRVQLVGAADDRQLGVPGVAEQKADAARGDEGRDEEMSISLEQLSQIALAGTAGDPEGEHPDVVHIVRQLPPHSAKLGGQLFDVHSAICIDVRPAHAWQRRHEADKSVIAGVDGGPRRVAVEAEHHIPTPVAAQIAGCDDASMAHLLVRGDEPQHPDLRMEEVSRPRTVDGVDRALEEGSKVTRPCRGRDHAGLAEDVDPIDARPQRLHHCDEIGCAREVEARKCKWNRQCTQQIERVGRRDGSVEVHADRWSQRIEQKRPRVRRQHRSRAVR